MKVASAWVAQVNDHLMRALAEWPLAQVVDLLIALHGIDRLAAGGGWRRSYTLSKWRICSNSRYRAQGRPARRGRGVSAPRKGELDKQRPGGPRGFHPQGRICAVVRPGRRRVMSPGRASCICALVDQNTICANRSVFLTD